MAIENWQISPDTKTFAARLRKDLDAALQDMVALPDTGCPSSHASDLDRLSMKVKVLTDLCDRLSGDPRKLQDWMLKR